jgi:tetratricopeptide (TPR) repeat protein
MTKRIIVTVLTACLVCGALFAQQKKAKDYITEGQNHMKNGNYAEAVAAFDAALKLEPKNKDAPKLLKEAQEKRMQEAFEQAQKLHQEEKYEEAVTLYNAAIRYAPPGTNTRNIQLRRNEAQEAIARVKLQAEQEEQKTLTEQQKILEEQQRQLEEQQKQLAEQQRQREEQERLAKAQAERERAEQTRQMLQRANDLLIGGKYSDAIARYEEAIAMEGLNRTETTETNRLIAEAKALQAEMDKFNRPLQDSDFEVAQSGNIITITKYKASTSKTITVNGNNHTVYFGIVNVNIPQRVFGQNLSIIGPEAFKNCGLQSVVIPDTVTEIGYGAFANNNLEKVTLGKGLKIIKGGVSQGTVEVSELGAFEGNKSLTEITIPDTVTEIGARAFKDCGLKKITLGKLVQTIGESAFRNNQLLDAALLPSVRYIRRFAYHQNQIKNLLIPNSILEIYDEAFTNNPMESIVIPASLAQTTTINNLPCPRIGGYNAKYTASSPLTFPHTLILVTLPANMHDDNLATFEASLREYYTVNKKAAGVYVKNGPVWNFRR